jgi:hypothetical protein
VYYFNSRDTSIKLLIKYLKLLVFMPWHKTKKNLETIDYQNLEAFTAKISLQLIFRIFASNNNKSKEEKIIK